MIWIKDWVNNGLNLKMYKRLPIIILMAAVISILMVAPTFAGEYGGSITSLHPDKASYPNPGETITITSQGILTDTKGHGKTLSGSQIVYQITDGSGNVVATHTSTLGNMVEGDTFTDTWQTTNTNFPVEGSYALSAT